MLFTSPKSSDRIVPGGKGLQQQALRWANARAVLTLVGFSNGLSNADIARLSGLAPQTVSAILVELDDAGLITRGEVLRGRRGQPATPIFLRANSAFSIGVEISIRELTVVLLDMHANVLHMELRPNVLTPCGAMLDQIADMVRIACDKVAEPCRSRLLDLGVAVSAHFPQELLARGLPQAELTLWHDRNLALALQQRTGLEVSVLSDGNAASWAELIACPAPRPAQFTYVLVGDDLATGIVEQGTLWEGPTGNAADLGSMLVVDSQGHLRPARVVASLTSLADQLAAVGLSLERVLADGAVESVAETTVERWLDDCAQVLAHVLFNAGTVVSGALAIIDGKMPPELRDRMVARADLALRKLPVDPSRLPQVAAGHLGMLAPAIGAAELTLYRRHFSRSALETAV
ncbi:MAG: ROK family transcriptional regulator [Alphaproteobacteria bacterium]|nr:ROK family transcriptional regulator [Alphaproteobacteria bacterium]